MIQNEPRGFSIMAIIMILLMVGLLMMTALANQLSSQQKINSEERGYLRSYNRAISLLNWGDESGLAGS